MLFVNKIESSVESVDSIKRIFVCHGILGSGLNWRTFCRNLQKVRPELEFHLIDLRCHGRSPTLKPPHTVESCANDLLDLMRDVGTPHAIIGHSFGGKVVLSVAQQIKLEQYWVLDSPPGPLSDKPEDRHEVSNVIAALRSIPLPIQKRGDVKDLLMSRGFSEAIALWMTTNVKWISEEKHYVWRFDIDGVESMIKDYFRQDFWDIIETHEYGQIHLVRAADSDRWTDSIKERLKEQQNSKIHVLPNSGHWLHVDNPSGLIHILNRYLLPN